MVKSSQTLHNLKESKKRKTNPHKNNQSFKRGTRSHISRNYETAIIPNPDSVDYSYDVKFINNRVTDLNISPVIVPQQSRQINTVQALKLKQYQSGFSQSVKTTKLAQQSENTTKVASQSTRSFPAASQLENTTKVTKQTEKITKIVSHLDKTTKVTNQSESKTQYVHQSQHTTKVTNQSENNAELVHQSKHTIKVTNQSENNALFVHKSKHTLPAISQLEKSQVMSQPGKTQEKAPHDYKAENYKLQMKLSALTQDKDHLEQENYSLRMQMSDYQKEVGLRLGDLKSANEKMTMMSQVINTKSCEFSAMRLNEERLLLDNNKLRNELKASKEKEIIFDSIKGTLNEMIVKDNVFCNNVIDTDPSLLTDKDSIDVLNFIIVDYVAGKQEHVDEVKRINAQIKGYIGKIGSYKKNIVDLVMKIQAQGLAIKAQSDCNSELQRYLQALKQNLKELGKKLKVRDDNIIQLKTAMNKEKNERLTEVFELKTTIQDLEEKETKCLEKISDPQKGLEQNQIIPVSNPNYNDEELKTRMAEEEADHFVSLQKYISNLDAMKTKVFTILI